MLEHALDLQPAVRAGRRLGLLELEGGVAALEHERADLIVEPGLVVDVAPAHGRRRDAGAACQEAPEHRAGPRRADTHHAALVLVQRVAEGRADGLPDLRAHPGPALVGDLGEIGVVYVPRERDDRRGRLAVLARADLADVPAHGLEGVMERGPVLEVGTLADLLAEPSGGL